ncbi:MAG TPA: NAD-dependent protein deacetylase [Polyangiaceae bacterium]|nr:NAD-dependent protein deacetylase [Polyangiaceae bacterium]
MSGRAPPDGLRDLARGGRVVALTGAGISTESGIPDYRSPEALLRPRRPVQGPEFARSEGARKRYWARSALGWERMRGAQPNAGHLALAHLEGRGVVDGIITQNVDRLHHKAGSRRVVELHGALAEVGCLDCSAVEDRDSVQRRMIEQNPAWTSQEVRTAPDGDADLPPERVERFEVPSCTRCGGVLKPRVVFFGDNVPRSTVAEAFAAVDAAALLLVVGSSLAVFSGYRFLRRAAERGIPIAIVNRGPVRGEEHARLKVDAGAGATLEALAVSL